MKVSIITVCYNSEATIKDTISSVLNQTYSDIEYIIMDGQSIDSTLEILDQYSSDIAKIVSEPDNGMYDALNKAIDLCTGEVIAILNSDDVYADDSVIEEIVERFKEEKADAVYGDLVYVSKDNLSTVSRFWKAGNFNDNKFVNGWMPPHPSFFVKKSCYIKYGKFNLGLVSAADYELMLRFIHKHKIKLAYLDRVLVYMREGGLSNTTFSSRLRGNKEDKLAWKINNLKPRFYTTYLKPIRKIQQFLPKKKRTI